MPLLGLALLSHAVEGAFASTEEDTNETYFFRMAEMSFDIEYLRSVHGREFRGRRQQQRIRHRQAD